MADEVKMVKVHCGICGNPRSRGDCKIIRLTLQEQKLMEAQGENRKEYIYCKPCWRTLSNPEAGPNLGKGIIETKLRQLGVSNAEQVAESFHQKLKDRITVAKK